MGLFSFLSGKSDAATEAPEKADRRAEAKEPGVPGQTDSTFVAPEAWSIDTAALTAPVATPPSGPEIGPTDPAVTAELQGPIINVIKTVYDPEIPVDIYELGLIYDIAADTERRVKVKMTLTSPACPSAQQIPSEVRYKVKAVPGVTDAAVEIVWEPPWDKDRMSEAAKLQLGFF